ncbi:MAG: hypothetical protein ACETWG_02925 [Candidatus Neomarinimicrobiota bacterium]
MSSYHLRKDVWDRFSTVTEPGGAVPFPDSKEFVKDIGQGADSEGWKQKGISAAAIALVNLSESTGVKER